MNRFVKAVRGPHDVAFDAVVGRSRFGERRTTLCPQLDWILRMSSQIKSRSELHFFVCSMRKRRTSSTIGSVMVLPPSVHQENRSPDSDSRRSQPPDE